MKKQISIYVAGTKIRIYYTSVLISLIFKKKLIKQVPKFVLYLIPNLIKMDSCLPSTYMFSIVGTLKVFIVPQAYKLARTK